MGTQNNGTDDLEKKFHGTYLTAANMFSNLYGLGQEFLKQAFQDGERHSLENLHSWILDKGPHVPAEDIIAYIQNEIYNEGFPQPVQASQHHQGPMHASAPHNPIIPHTTPTATVSSTIKGDSQRNYVSFYHGESAAGHQFHGDGQENEMETNVYFSEVTGHCNQSNVGLCFAPSNSKQDDNVIAI